MILKIIKEVEEGIQESSNKVIAKSIAEDRMGVMCSFKCFGVIKSCQYKAWEYSQGQK